MPNWGASCGHWRCGVEASITATYDESVEVTVTCYWQSLGWGFQVDYCNAWVSCDGQGDGLLGTASVYSDYGETRTVSQYTQTFAVARGATDRSIECGAAFRLPDYEAGASRATMWLTVPAYACDAPAAPTGLTAKRVSDASVSVSWTNNATKDAPWASIEFQAREKESSWGSAQGGQKTLDGSAISHVWTGGRANSYYSFRIRSVNPNSKSAWVESGIVKTTPAAPTNLKGAFDGSQVVLSWTNSAKGADSTTIQRSTDGTTWAALATASGTATGYTDAEPPTGNVWYRVAFVGGSLMGEWATVGAISTYTSEDYPAVTITSSTTPQVRPFTATWTVTSPTDVKSQQYALIVGGQVVESGTMAKATRSHSFALDGLADGQSGTLLITATNANNLTTTAVQTLKAAYVAPAAPVVTIDYNLDALTAALTVKDGGGTAKATSIDVVRVNPDGTLETLAEGASPTVKLTDSTPPLNADYTYRITATARSGKYSAVDVSANLAAKCGAVTFADGTTVATALDWEESTDTEAAGTSLELADGGAPVFYPSGTVSRSASVGFSVKGEAAITAFLNLVESDADGTVTLRSPHGRVWHGHPSWSCERNPQWLGVECDLDVTGRR